MENRSASSSTGSSSTGSSGAGASDGIQWSTALYRFVLYACLLAAIGIAGFAFYQSRQADVVLKATQETLVAEHHLTAAVQKHLAPEFTDKQGRLLADPPSEPEKLLDPDTLVVAHYIDAEAETQAVDWEAFEARLAQATGKKIVRQEYQNTVDDVADIKAGKIHIVALHAADVPYVVNHAGFIPVAVLGSEEETHGNRLDIAVPASSTIKTLADLRGKTLTCASPDSITGYRAAIVVLAREAGLRPDVDYAITFSLGPKRSAQGLAEGEYEVAALSDDKVESLLKKKKIKKSAYRIVYQSEVIPRLSIGYVYNLQPELAAKIVAATMEFSNEKGEPEEAGEQPLRFKTIDYKRDFEFARKMDDCFDPRFHKAAKTKSAAESSVGAENE